MTEDMGAPITPDEEKGGRNWATIIIAIVVLLLLCACCASLVLAWNYGDAVVRWLNSLGMIVRSAVM